MVDGLGRPPQVVVWRRRRATRRGRRGGVGRCRRRPAPAPSRRRRWGPRAPPPARGVAGRRLGLASTPRTKGLRRPRDELRRPLGPRAGVRRGQLLPWASRRRIGSGLQVDGEHVHPTPSRVRTRTRGTGLRSRTARGNGGGSPSTNPGNGSSSVAHGRLDRRLARGSAPVPRRSPGATTAWAKPSGQRTREGRVVADLLERDDVGVCGRREPVDLALEHLGLAGRVGRAGVGPSR